MTLLAGNTSTLRQQPGPTSSMRVNFEQEFETSTGPTVLGRATWSAPEEENDGADSIEGATNTTVPPKTTKTGTTTVPQTTKPTTPSIVPSASASSLPPTTYWHNNHTRVVGDSAYRRIPTWMKEYFDWHRVQTTTMTPTNWYHEKRKYLIIRCLRGQRCGGLSDRIKPMPGELGIVDLLHVRHTQKNTYTAFWYFLIFFLIYLITRFFISLCSPGRPYPSDPDDSLDQVRY